MNKWRKLLVLAGFCSAFSAAHAGAFEDFFAATRRDDESTVVKLVLRGFDLNTRDEQGNHALLVAIREGSLKVADFLLEQPLVQVEARNPRGESPLMMAAIKGHLPLAKRLIERKAEVNKPGWAPLHYAASNPEPVGLELVRLLLEHHAYIDAESPNKTTPLMMAAKYGSPAVVQLLLEEGADATLKNEQNLTALDFAQRAERKDAVRLLTAALRSRQPTGTW
ncbi:MAG: ankyrin repeat domain-containing protein [Hydrogenophaga sp.]|uniref:ankyrin repeat domain-containing protein n=1 Tax=Hydrogenophaga sp. TaxID=1904254 RepID=UPI003D9AF772